MDFATVYFIFIGLVLSGAFKRATILYTYHKEW